jgi:uncharacterized pyridoxamine 5'-phosphate oxidase family protein
MNNFIISREYIWDVLKLNKFAVLATESGGQPHASLIAITPFGDFRQLIFATYRNTRKYRNLSKNNKVAILIENGDVKMEDPQESIVLTIFGHIEEIIIEENEAVYQAHLKRHPEMESFMLSSDCALILVIAQAYQIVYGIDDIRWITADELDVI